MKIQALQCKLCGDTIYSRARHDFRPCSCDNCFVDGGFDYFRAGAKNLKEIEAVEIEVDANGQDLAQDYFSNTNKYGLIKP
jgi:hypothetical protein